MDRACWLALCQANDSVLSINNFNERVLHSDFKSLCRLWQQSLKWLCILNGRQGQGSRKAASHKKEKPSFIFEPYF